MVKYDKIPIHMRDCAREYIEHGRLDSDFLRAVLTNNLMEAFTRADDINCVAMLSWVKWLYNDCPKAAFGSDANVRNWIEIHFDPGSNHHG